MPMVIYNCPIFVKVSGWSFTLSPSRHTKFSFIRLKTEKVAPQHILSLGTVSRPFRPANLGGAAEELASLPRLPAPC